MEMSQVRLAALKQQQKRLIKYQVSFIFHQQTFRKRTSFISNIRTNFLPQEETKQQLDEMNRDRSQETQPSTSNDNYSGIQVRFLFSFKLI